MKALTQIVLLLGVLSSAPSAFAWCQGEYDCRTKAAEEQSDERMRQNEQAMYDREHAALAELMGATFVPITGHGAPGEYWINGGQIVCGYSDWGGGLGCVDRQGNPAPQYVPSEASIRAAMARADGRPYPTPSYHHRHRHYRRH